jgi:hypothetical protein
MRKIAISLILALGILAGVFGIFTKARGQIETNPHGEKIMDREVQGEAIREITAPGETPDQPLIGFIDSPSAVCYQPDPTEDLCNINWYYMSVDAAPNYMITMTVTLNDIGRVAHVTGFFQTSIYVPYNMLGEGFQVACGALGAGGNPNLGNAYPWTIRARDSANLGSANYGTVYCPAYTP